MVSPEFAVLKHPGFTEYRVENWHLARDGTGRIVKGVSKSVWQYSLLPLLASLLWPSVHDYFLALSGLILISAFLTYFKCTQVVFESVIVIPYHGIQLETHRGLPWFPSITVERRFIPIASLQDFVIHEGLSGWNVRYYLAAVRLSRSGNYQLHVAYENILPHFAILLEVYRGVQAALPSSG
ncbi:hypothetical protein B0H15DRAFT_638770 [Mycena belliarum]|uniref:Phosphatidylinositol N-acetylglucosaminyltransferase subunit H conserved domain-containing protein n=1 Tax=Mycena belliarum TaxID=1033014 RepID=A0AAD6UEV5_9AGAR|nr:hypothetical protein B0H15DRAFT_638770 [Mycena belliae]